MSELEALQKEIERLDQKIAEIMKSSSAKDKDEIVDGLMKRIQALEDKIASASAAKMKEFLDSLVEVPKPKGRPKKEKAETKAEPKEEPKPKKDEKQIDFTEEDMPWWERV